jgi:hypothetical protein
LAKKVVASSKLLTLLIAGKPYKPSNIGLCGLFVLNCGPAIWPSSRKGQVGRTIVAGAERLLQLTTERTI